MLEIGKILSGDYLIYFKGDFHPTNGFVSESNFRMAKGKLSADSWLPDLKTLPSFI